MERKKWDAEDATVSIITLIHDESAPEEDHKAKT